MLSRRRGRAAAQEGWAKGNQALPFSDTSARTCLAACHVGAGLLEEAEARADPRACTCRHLKRTAPGKANKEQLDAYTEQIMEALARLLPLEYRGVYAELARQELPAGV